MNSYFSFNVNFAKKYGVDEAIVFNSMLFWIKCNYQKGSNFKDGKTWTYNTYEQWTQDIPCYSLSAIRRVIKSLEDKKLITSSSKYNKFKIDNTKWYAITDFGFAEISLCDKEDPINYNSLRSGYEKYYDDDNEQEISRIANEKSEQMPNKDLDEITDMVNETGIWSNEIDRCDLSKSLEQYQVNNQYKHKLNQQSIQTSNALSNTTIESELLFANAHNNSLYRNENTDKNKNNTTSDTENVDAQKVTSPKPKKTLAKASTAKAVRGRKYLTDVEIQEFYDNNPISETESKVLQDTVNKMLEVRKSNDPKFNLSQNAKSNWRLRLFKFLRKSGRDTSELERCFNFAMNDKWWRNKCVSPDFLINSFDTLMQRSASGNYVKNKSAIENLGKPDYSKGFWG